MSRWDHVSKIVLFLTVWGIAAPAQAQLRIEGSPLWGFDGKVRAGQFNLLTLEIVNPSDRPWQGGLQLQAVVGFRGSDVPIRQPEMFIEPHGRRQLQFLVFVPDPSEYTLKWGRGQRDEERIPEPSLAHHPAIVQLRDDDAITTGLRGVPDFPASAFPSSAAGLDGLGTVLLNHVPRWNELQRQAFRDWLHAGGTLHLFQIPGGTFPRFSGDLVELNEPSDTFIAGGGRVIRHAMSLQQAPNEFGAPASADVDRYRNWSTESSLFSILRAMTTPEHNWSLIYLMAVLYLLLLFPGCWLIGRQRGDFRVTYAAILAVVGLFSVGFHTVGRRGYGERTTINSVAIARPAADGRTILTQWSNLFVTTGGNHLISHQAEGLAYSTGQDHETVRGQTLNRPQAALLVDIPSFSSRPFLHTGVLANQGLRVNIDKIEFDDETLKTLELSVPGGRELWGDDPQFHARVLHRDRMAPLLRRADSTLALSGSGTPLTQQLDPDQWHAFQTPWVQVNSQSPDDLYRQTVAPLIASDLRIFNHEDLDRVSLPETELRIYLFTTMPEAFFAAGDVSAQQFGRVLHVIPIPVESSPTPDP